MTLTLRGAGQAKMCCRMEEDCPSTRAPKHLQRVIPEDPTSFLQLNRSDTGSGVDYISTSSSYVPLMGTRLRETAPAIVVPIPTICNRLQQVFKISDPFIGRHHMFNDNYIPREILFRCSLS